MAANNPYSGDDQALQSLLADSTADQTQRAAAFEEKYKDQGITARVGENGEISFSNVPGRDVYGPYMKAAVQTPAGKEAVAEKLVTGTPDEKAAATEALGGPGTIAVVTEEGNVASTQIDLAKNFSQPVNTDALFSQQYQAMSKLEKPEDVINARANLIQSTEDWIRTKHGNYKLRAEAANGVAALQAEVRRNEAMDRAAYAQYNGGVDLGDSDETLLVKRQLEQAQVKAEAEAGAALAEDPEVKGARARLQAIDGLANTKLDAAYKDMEANSKDSELSKLVLPEQIAAVQLALGQDPTKPLDPALEKELKAEIVTGRPGRMNQAMEIGLTTDNSTLLATSMESGTTGLYASNALRSKLGGDEGLEKALKAEAQKQLALANAPELDKDGKPKIQLQAPTKEQQAAANQQALLTARNNVKIARDAKFHASLKDWEEPQNPAIQAEVKSIIQVMETERAAKLKADPNYVPENDPTQTFEGAVARMNLYKEDGTMDQAKAQAVADWYSSQASKVPGNDYFGPPAAALDPLSRVQSIAARNQAESSGLGGWWGMGTSPNASDHKVLVQGALAIQQASQSNQVNLFKPAEFGTYGNPNPAVVDPNYEAITNYYRGRAGVDPAWIEERDKNIAAAKGGQ